MSLRIKEENETFEIQLSYANNWEEFTTKRTDFTSPIKICVQRRRPSLSLLFKVSPISRKKSSSDAIHSTLGETR
jgi:hypothetical protein